MAEDEQAAQNEGEARIIQPMKIFLKDVSFETPNSPQIFTVDWKPKLAFEISKQATHLEDDLYEIVLTLTVTMKIEDSAAYLVEVHQGGIFQLNGLDPETLNRVQQVFCLRTLYPYACAEVWDLVDKGGFPQLNLPPMNFNLLYQQSMKAAQEENAASNTDS